MLLGLNFKVRITVLLFFLFIPATISLILNYIDPKNDFLVTKHIAKIERPNEINADIIRDSRDFINYEATKFLISFEAFSISVKNYIYLFIAPYRLNDSYIWSHNFGFYPIETVKRFFNDKRVDSRYINENSLVLAELKIIETILAKKNIKFFVIKPPTKIQLLPEGIDNIFYNTKDILKKREITTNKENFLIDFESISNKYNLKGDEVFSHLGFHWNYYSSCLFTNEFLLKINSRLIDCEDFEYKNPQLTDVDIFIMHPFFGRNNFTKKLKYPNLSKDTIDNLPKIAIIGDSFTDQIIYNIIHSTHSDNLERITFYDYFDVRKKVNPDGTYVNSPLVLDEKLLEEIESNQVILIVLSDSNFPREINSNSFYGFHSFIKSYYAF